MKWIVYSFKSTMQIVDENGGAVDKEFIGTAKAEYSEEKLEHVKATAYNGEYTIEDDGQPDPAETPSQLDVIEAQVTYTAMMTDTLLEV